MRKAKFHLLTCKYRGLSNSNKIIGIILSEVFDILEVLGLRNQIPCLLGKVPSQLLSFSIDSIGFDM